MPGRRPQCVSGEVEFKPLVSCTIFPGLSLREAVNVGPEVPRGGARDQLHISFRGFLNNGLGHHHTIGNNDLFVFWGSNEGIAQRQIFYDSGLLYATSDSKSD